jgi:uncharacterized protein (DUF58 family)
MRWFVAVLALTVLGAMFGSVAALVLGRPTLTVPREVVSLDVKDGRPSRMP